MLFDVGCVVPVRKFNRQDESLDFIRGVRHDRLNGVERVVGSDISVAHEVFKWGEIFAFDLQRTRFPVRERRVFLDSLVHVRWIDSSNLDAHVEQ